MIDSNGRRHNAGRVDLPAALRQQKCDQHDSAHGCHFCADLEAAAVALEATRPHTQKLLLAIGAAMGDGYAPIRIPKTLFNKVMEEQS